jgi:hypothetical protein
MQNIDEAYRMLDAFSSVDARHFDVIFLDIHGTQRGFRKEQSVAQIRTSLAEVASDPTLPPVFIASARKRSSSSSTLHSGRSDSFSVRNRSIGSTNFDI